jgi:hypothetical protein
VTAGGWRAPRGVLDQIDMRRRSATGLGVLLAVGAVGGAMAISDRLADARRGERSAYAAALAEREAAASAAGAGQAQPVEPGRSRTLCLRGAETISARVARFLDARVVDGAGRLDLSSLARTSRRAAELDRSASVPQRMGRRRAVGAEAGAGAQPVWQPIEPPDRICVELAELSHGKRRAAGAK